MADDDWRLRGQDFTYLKGATLAKKKYWDRRPQDDHDHCEFCWTKFMVVPYTPANEIILTEGYAVQGRSPNPQFPNDYYWVCPQCVADLVSRFEWTVLGD